MPRRAGPGEGRRRRLFTAATRVEEGEERTRAAMDDAKAGSGVSPARATEADNGGAGDATPGRQQQTTKGI